MRCLSLAGELSASGWNCTFAVRAGTHETVSALAASGVPCLILEGNELEEASELASRWPEGTDWLIVDHYGRDGAHENSCRPWAERILVIDDLADRDHDCDILLDQTLGRKAEDYAGRVPTGGRFLLGCDYALLNPAFHQRRDAVLRRRKKSSEVRRIIVSVGLTDPLNVTTKALDALESLKLDVAVDVVLGSQSQGLDAILERVGGHVTVHTDVANMADLFAAADIAVGAGGITSWERCCLGLPTVGVVTADNQVNTMDALSSAGAISVAGRLSVVTVEGLAAALETLIGDKEKRSAMSRAAANVCDGQGIHRVREAMQA